MFRKIIDVVTVWTTTIVANSVNFLSQDLINSLPIVKDLLSILSLILAIGFTVYKFCKDWKGLIPWRKKQ